MHLYWKKWIFHLINGKRGIIIIIHLLLCDRKNGRIREIGFLALWICLKLVTTTPFFPPPFLWYSFFPSLNLLQRDLISYCFYFIYCIIIIRFDLLGFRVIRTVSFMFWWFWLVDLLWIWADLYDCAGLRALEKVLFHFWSSYGFKTYFEGIEGSAEGSSHILQCRYNFVHFFLF